MSDAVGHDTGGKEVRVGDMVTVVCIVEDIDPESNKFKLAVREYTTPDLLTHLTIPGHLTRREDSR